MKIAAGTTFGSYEIVHPVGAGGMGNVYRARDLRLGRDLAIKFLHDDLSKNRLQLHRFERDARAASALNHPSIITIYEIGEHQGNPYIAMEFVDGRRLRDVLMEGALPIERGLEIAVSLADALGTAHGRGIMHRDLKPENVMITAEGRVKILDFGLAKALDPAATAPDSNAETLPGVVVGTAGYMSPEQAKGLGTDFRSDQFALGTMLYEIFSGRSPFRRGTSMETISAILRDVQQPLNEVNPQIPGELAEMVDRCLQKDPANRYASTADLAHDLRQLHKRYTSASHSLPSFAPANRLAGRRGVLVLATAGVLLALAALLFVLRRNEAATPPSQDAAVSQQSRKTLVILPFLEGTGELRDQGLSMIVSAQLGSVGGLQVIPPWGIPPDRDRHDIRALARFLDATYALSTTVSRAGGELRVAFSLLDPATGKQIAGNTIQGEAANPFGVAERLANEIAAALDVRIDHPSLPGDLLSFEAQDSFLAAAGALIRYDDPAMVDQAIALLEPLAESYRDSALVHAALGRAYQSKYELSKDRAWIERAVSASTRASRLNPKRPEVHVTLSKLFAMTGKPDQAIIEARKALQLHADDSEALLALAAAYQKKNDPASAEATYRRAIALKPRHWAAYNGLGTHYYFQGRYPEAAEMFSKVVELTPDNSRGVTNLAGALMQMGRYESAVEVFRRATEARPQDP
ncbi:MAG TPA: protein kinase, partial [Thermoanaerobaculia bacterium]